MSRAWATDESLTWRERAAALRYVPPFVRMAWETHRGLASAMVLLRLARAAVPVATLWVGKLIIDAVVASAENPSANLPRLWALVAFELLITFAGEVLARGSSLVESLLGDLFTMHTSLRLMEHSATLDLYQFEEPEFHDRLERARQQTTARVVLLVRLLSIGQDLLTLVSLAGALLFYNFWLLLLLVVAVFPGFLGETHFASLEYFLRRRRTPERRRLDYLRFLGASEHAAKEVQAFGLARWLVARYSTLARKFYEENKRMAVRRSLVSTALSLVAALGYYGAYVQILLSTVRGAITLGTLVFLAGAFMRGRDLVQRTLASASDIFQQSLYLKDLFDFFETRPTIRSAAGAPAVPNPVREGFVFEGVGFRYPGSERWAVRNVNLSLRPGERLALVGENGAGKTTLAKLLARLYDPTEGRILLDGRDLREYEVESVRRAVGVIFQDFMRYDMRFDENIGVGEIGEVRDYLDAEEREDNGKKEKEGKRKESEAKEEGGGKKTGAGREAEGRAADNGRVPQRIEEAAEKSLAASLLPRLSAGYRQMLGRRFQGGVELSGGEWQKIALARAYMRDSQVLILDEPTASLDARAEFNVFRRFSELVTGRMAVIISHRFSTVRIADRIVVLEGGRVIEEGTHEELMSRGGPYAELFTMQAAGYR